MSDLVRSEVEAALEYANNLLGTHLRRDRIQPALAAARAWLSTPTEPTTTLVLDERVAYYGKNIHRFTSSVNKAGPTVLVDGDTWIALGQPNELLVTLAASRVAEETL